MPNKPYVSLQDRFNDEEERLRWGVPPKKKPAGKIDKIQEAIHEGWIQPESDDSEQDPIAQNVAAVQQKASKKLRRFFNGKTIEPIHNAKSLQSFQTSGNSIDL